MNIVFFLAGRGELQVILTGSTSPNEGLVEVFLDGSWGTICDDNWDISVGTGIHFEKEIMYVPTLNCFSVMGKSFGVIW